MGGGGDSRIPRLLREQFAGTDLRCIVRTYDFDPEIGHAQIASWVEELRPVLVIGESLGAIQALRIRGIPHLFVSPSLGAPDFLVRLAWICKVPGGKALLHRIWRVKEGDRQPLRFEYDILKKYAAHWAAAKKAAADERERALKDIQNASDSALQELAVKSADIATELAGKILKERIDASKHSQLIEEAVQKITQK